MKNLGFGLGLRSQHYDYVLEHKPKIDWFEIISENYMNSHGRARDVLEQVRADYPIVMHGVSMSIGSSDALNMRYLQKLRDLADEVQPEWISDHLCWTGINGKNTHDLLPVPLTEECLAHVVERIKRVQDFLGRQILLENPSSYLTYRADEIPEYEFMARMAEAADCKLLLDVNNVYVASFNQRLSPYEYIDALPLERVVQVHLAGHENKGTHIVDTHDGPVIDDVWELYKYASSREGFAASTMVEWDDKIPEFPVLEAELNKAREYVGQKAEVIDLAEHKSSKSASNHAMRDLHLNLQTAILDGDVTDASTWISPKQNFAPEEQLAVYATGYRLRLAQIISSDYAASSAFFGTGKIREYIENVESESYDVAAYSAEFAGWLHGQEVEQFAKDLVRLEAEISHCYDQPPATPISYEDLANLDADDFVGLKIAPVPSAKLLEFENDVHAYLNDFYESVEPETMVQKTFLIVYQNAGKVYRMQLEEMEFLLLGILSDGKAIGEAMEDLVRVSGMDEEELSDKIQVWFSRWMQAGFLGKLAIAPE